MSPTPPEKPGKPGPTPPAPGREKVRIRWALGGPFVEGEFDPASGLVHCKRNGRKVRISIHGPVIHWIEDPA